MGFIINPYQFGVPFTGLLDTYSGAAAAYSAARRLSSTYTGSLIRVRRSSDNAEQDIGYNGSNVLDESALTSFVGAGNGFVTTWYDQSGNGRNFIQTTASDQPQIVTSGTVIKNNSKPAIELVSSDNLIAQNLGAVTRADHFGVFDQTNTLGVLLNNNSNAYLLVSQSGNSSTSLDQNSGTPSYYFNNTLFTGTTRGDLYNQIQNQKVFNIQNSNLTSWTNNTNQIQLLYGGFTMNGYWQEYIVYHSDQSANRSGINTNINTFYSIY